MASATHSLLHARAGGVPVVHRDLGYFINVPGNTALKGASWSSSMESIHIYVEANPDTRRRSFSRIGDSGAMLSDDGIQQLQFHVPHKEAHRESGAPTKRASTYDLPVPGSGELSKLPPKKPVRSPRRPIGLSYQTLLGAISSWAFPKNLLPVHVLANAALTPVLPPAQRQSLRQTPGQEYMW